MDAPKKLLVVDDGTIDAQRVAEIVEQSGAGERVEVVVAAPDATRPQLDDLPTTVLVNPAAQVRRRRSIGTVLGMAALADGLSGLGALGGDAGWATPSRDWQKPGPNRFEREAMEAAEAKRRRRAERNLRNAAKGRGAD